MIENLDTKNSLHRSAFCENCHGASSRWISLHYKPEWSQLSASQRQIQYGMTDLSNLAERARVCMSCHVGDQNREVNHTLIAAGHPALRFEFAAFLAEPVYTRHWADNQLGRDGEAWIWLVGQASLARQSTRLLVHRTEPSRSKDWPELAEYACFSCHRNLDNFGIGPTIRDHARIAMPRPGDLPWGSWSYSLPIHIKTKLNLGLKTSHHDRGMTQLADLFHKQSRPTIDIAHHTAKLALSDLDTWATELAMLAQKRSRQSPLTDEEIREIIRYVIEYALSIRNIGERATSWERHTQSYLGVSALYRSLCQVNPAHRDVQVEKQLVEVRRLLNYAPGTNGPVRWTQSDEELLQSHWQTISQRLQLGIQP